MWQASHDNKGVSVITKAAIHEYLDNNSAMTIYPNRNEELVAVHDWESDDGYLNSFEGLLVIRETGFGVSGEVGKHIKPTSLRDIRDALEEICVDGEATLFIYI